MNSSQTRRMIAAGMIGNVLEWYDFAIYGYFAAAIGRHFFPHEDAVAQLLSAFGVFAIGYLMRPVGGVLIGHIGDRFGRRAALTFSVAAMAIPTFLIGLLPGYTTLGLAAPIALTLLRMLQGLSVGGEYTSSMVFLVEHAPAGRRGLMGALASCGACGGILLGSAVGAGFAASMSDVALDAWGWRIPFLLGLVVGIAGYFLRRHVLETLPAERRKRAPIVETLHDHWRIVLGFAGLSVFNAVSFYVGFVYLVSWLQTADGIAPGACARDQFIEHGGAVARHDRDRPHDRPHRAQARSPARRILGFVGAVPLFLLLNDPSDLSAQLGQLGLASSSDSLAARSPPSWWRRRRLRCAARR
jgi:MFS transporter, MHS family, proline/betaine transporter